VADGYIHGGTDPREVARLEKQARWCAPWLLERFDVPGGARVLDLATGVGAMAGQLKERYGDALLHGLDLSETQLRCAKQNHPGISWARGDGQSLPFRDDCFDRVHWSWFLEHVSPDAAVQVLEEVRRVLKSDGYCHFTEVDNSTFRTEPPLPHVQQAMEALNRRQLQGGGDPFIGPKLEGYLAAAGFRRIDVRPTPTRGDATDPVFFQGFVDEFVEIFESLDEALGQPPLLKAAAAELSRLPGLSGASIHYRGTIAQAWK
jgi:ubiquinone/menaquinone biosynthesis C-methylase UbiE